MRKILLLLLPGILLTVVSYAQNIKTSTIKWTSSVTLTVNEGYRAEETTYLTSFGSSRLEWKDQEGSILKSFQIVEVIGDWSNPNTNGSLQYEIKEGTSNGTVTIRKTADGTKILFVIVSSPASQGPVSDPPQTIELSIQSFQTL
jgi:hypothetical protein